MIGVLVDILKYSLKREVVCENAGAIARILEVGRPSVVQSTGAFFMGLVIRNLKFFSHFGSWASLLQVGALLR